MPFNNMKLNSVAIIRNHCPTELEGDTHTLTQNISKMMSKRHKAVVQLDTTGKALILHKQSSRSFYENAYFCLLVWQVPLATTCVFSLAALLAPLFIYVLLYKSTRF